MRKSIATFVLTAAVLMGPVQMTYAVGPAEIRDLLEQLEDRTDASSLIQYARLLIEGVPVSDENPLRVPDYASARNALEAASQQSGAGQVEAKVMLAKMLLKGQGGSPDRPRALQVLEESVAAGSGEAAFILGEELRTDPAKVSEALASYQTALRLGYARAGLVIADLLSETDPQLADKTRFLAIALLETQAADRRASAAMALARHNLGLNNDPLAASRALEWFKRAAALGESGALISAAELEASPSSTAYDPRDAGQLYLDAANSGSLDAALAIVIDHENEDRFGTSEDEAARWANFVLETGDVQAVLTYAALRSVSDERRRDVIDELYERLIGESSDVDGMLSLGSRLRSGKGVPQDLERAFVLFQRASALGSDTGALVVAEMMMQVPSLQASDEVREAVLRVSGLAESGNPEAEVLMGDFFLRGLGRTADRGLATQWYLRSAEHGSAEGMASLAQVYIASEDYETRRMALPWLVRSAELGNMESQLELADVYARGDIVERDVFKAIEAYRVAVAGQAPGALDALASVYLRIGGPGAASEADSIYRDAIEQNYPGAEVKYGAFLVETGQVAEAVRYLDRDQNAADFEVALLLQSVYFRGLTGAVDKAAGRNWLSRALQVAPSDPSQRVTLASELLASREPDFIEQGIELLIDLDKSGNAEASRLLAGAYLVGTGVDADVDRALDLYDRAIDLGSISAELDLGDAYLSGQGVRADFDRAVALFEDVATQDPNNAAANLRLGNLFADGMGGTPDPALAAQYYEAAADAGSTSAQRAIGLRFLWGDGVAQDATLAEHWLRMAANNGVSTAYRDLATLKSAAIGSGIAADAAFAFNLEAANRGDVDAMAAVGISLVQGFGIPVDSSAGVTWLTRAADLGSNAAMFDLYQIYQQGYGLPRDEQEAERWLIEAADAGNGSALYRQALALMDQKTAAAEQEGIRLLQKAARVEHNQSKKLLVKMGLLSPSDADDEATPQEDEGDVH